MVKERLTGKMVLARPKDDLVELKKISRKLGITSRQFVNIMEKEGHIDDMRIITLTPGQLVSIMKKSETVSNSVRALKRKGMTEFSIGWTIRMLLRAQKDMRAMAGMMEKLAGGLTRAEVKSINRTVEKRKVESLDYIA